MQAAATWATSQVGSTYSSHYGHYWSGWCEQFAEQAEGLRFSFTSAYLDYLAEAHAGTASTPTPTHQPAPRVLRRSERERARRRVHR